MEIIATVCEICFTLNMLQVSIDQSNHPVCQKQPSKINQSKSADHNKPIMLMHTGGDSGAGGGDVEEGSRFSCGNTCSIICCPKSKKEKENEHYWQINKK